MGVVESAKKNEIFCVARDGECPEDFDFEEVWHSRFLGNCMSCRFTYFRFVERTLKVKQMND